MINSNLTKFTSFRLLGLLLLWLFDSFRRLLHFLTWLLFFLHFFFGLLFVLNGDWSINNWSNLHQCLELASLNFVYWVFLFKRRHIKIEHLLGFFCLHSAMKIRFISLKNSIKCKLRDCQHLPFNIHDRRGPSFSIFIGP